MIHQDDQFTHQGREGDFGRFTRSAQALIKHFEDGIGTGGHQGRHIKCGAESRASPSNGSAPLPLSAFSWMGSHTCQRRNLAAIKGTQLRQFGQDGQGRAHSYPCNRLKGFDPLIQKRRLRGDCLELALDLFQRRFQVSDQAFGLTTQGGQGKALGLLALGHQQFQQLFATTDQFGQLRLDRRTRRGGFGAKRVAIGREDRSINRVSFGTLALGTGEKPDAGRVEEAHGNSRLMQGGDEVTFVATGSFTDHVNAWAFGQELKQPAMAGGRVGQVVKTTLEVELQVKLGNIQARIDSRHSVLAHSCKYELAFEGRSVNGSSLGHRSERFWLPTRLDKSQRQRKTNSSAPLPSRLQAGRQFHLPIHITTDKDR